MVSRRALVAGTLMAPFVAVSPAPAAPALSAFRHPASPGAAGAPGASGAAGATGAMVAANLRPRIRRRADWASGHPPMRAPVAEDVRFLLVHHTQTPNTDRAAGIPSRLRGMYDFHTREKGWPDLAYNFLVDAFGVVWEGRAGSLAGPVRGDATGGSQGFAQLCCFIGDHTVTPPTARALAAMTRLLAWLAVRDGVDLSAGRRVAFVSRGSNRWPRGARVTTDPVAGHRDMSLTECPGDALYPLVRSQLLPQARALAATARATVTATSGTDGPSLSPSPSSSPAQHRSTSPAANSASAGAVPATSDEGFTLRDSFPVLGVLGVAGGAALAARVARRRR